MVNKALLIASFPDSIVSFRGALIRDIRARGFDVMIAAPNASGVSGLVQWLASVGATFHVIPLRRVSINPLSDARLLFSLYRLFRENAPDLILPYTIKPVIYGLVAGWLARVPRRYALITGLGYTFAEKRNVFLSWVARSLYRIALGRSHKVFFQNPDDEKLFRQLGILRSDVPSVVVSGSGVNIEHYSVRPHPSGQPVFLLIGRLLGAKGVREYADAARSVRVRASAVRFLLAGWIDDNPDAISQSELSAYVDDGVLEYIGKLDDVRDAIACSTIYVLPSYREGTPRTILEAMAMGRAIITTDAPGCRETVIDGENGFLVPVKSVDALVDAMMKFIEDPALAARMGRRSREIAEEKYDVNKVNAVMLREMGITPIAAEESHA